MGHRCRRAGALNVDLGLLVRRQVAPVHGLRGCIPGEATRERLGVLLAEPCQFQVVLLRVRLALVVLHGRVVGVEPDLEAGHGDDAVDNRLLAAQLSACGEEGATVLAVVVDDDPHLPVGVERYWRRLEVSTRGMAPKAPAR